MVVGANEVFDNIVKYLRRNHPTAEGISMPYCALTTDSDETEKYYRAQVHFKISKEIFAKTAIFKADAETGKVFWFKEGFTWQYWV